MDTGELESNFEELRKQHNLTQKQLAERIGVNTSTVRNWEKGRTGLEIFELVARVCEALECQPRDLISSKKPVKKTAA
ncbi:MAG: helix-turn-helix transcriptional regulator [Microcoleaceae cyanobacterium]